MVRTITMRQYKQREVTENPKTKTFYLNVPKTNTADTTHLHWIKYKVPEWRNIACENIRFSTPINPKKYSCYGLKKFMQGVW